MMTAILGFTAIICICILLLPIIIASDRNKIKPYSDAVARAAACEGFEVEASKCDVKTCAFYKSNLRRNGIRWFAQPLCRRSNGNREDYYFFSCERWKS
jgi:hypothetical protein